MKSRNKKHNCIWIEVENHQNDVSNSIVALKATQLLRRLGVEHDSFQWVAKKATYIYSMGPDGSHGFYELPEDGHTMNLDYLAG